MSLRKQSRNVEMLGVVAKGLTGLREKVVFVGGATIDLFITDPGAPGTRETDDVDCVVELAGLAQYHVLEEQLRTLGFRHSMDERAPICRWMFCGIKVDVMPTEGAVLGFSNRWYPDGMAKAEEVDLPDGRRVFTFSVPYLLASKLEAFRDRGKGDYMASKDMEDIVALLDGCPDAERRIVAAPANVRIYLAGEFSRMLMDRLFLLSLDGHLRPGIEGTERIDRCLEIMRRVVELEKEFGR